MTILLVDDHQIVLEGMRALMAADFRGANVITATKAAVAREIIGQGGVDILVTDLELNGESGMALVKYAHETAPSTKIVIYTMHEEPWTIREMMDCEPDAVVMKGDSARELLAAVRAVADERGYYSTAFSRAFAALRLHPEPLSEREKQVLEMTASGLSTADAAARLGIAVSTVEFHRRRIMQKLKANNAAEMIRKAGELGWNVNF